MSSPARRAAASQLAASGVVVAHHAGGVRAERDHARAGQRREVEDLVGLEPQAEA